MHLHQVYCAILQHQIENIELLNVLDIFFLILLEYPVVQCCLSLPTAIRPISKDHIFHTVLFYFCKFLGFLIILIQIINPEVLHILLLILHCRLLHQEHRQYTIYHNVKFYIMVIM